MAGACMVVVGGACMAGGVRGRKNSNCSGGYTSYWNAFLFTFYFCGVFGDLATF